MFKDRVDRSQDRISILGSSLKDMRLDAVKKYFDDTNTQTQGKDLYSLMCREGLVNKDPSGEYIPTIAGLLLFGKKPQDYLSHAVIKADVRLSGSDDEWDDIQTFDGTIFDQIASVESFIKRNIPKSATIKGFRRVEAFLIPIVALREAVVNAIAHRDYNDNKAEIHLRIRDTSVSVHSPGGILPPLTVEIIVKGDFTPRTRNITIADALVRIGGFMDRRGTGIERMGDLMTGAGLAKPKFTESAGAFTVTFELIRKDSKKVKSPAPVISDADWKKLELDADHHKILVMVQEKGEIKPKEVDSEIGRTRPYTNKKLTELVDKMLLVKQGESSNPRTTYVLHPNLSQVQSNSSEQGILEL